MASHPLAHGLFHSCQVAVRVHRRIRPVALTFRDTLQFQLFDSGYVAWLVSARLVEGDPYGRKGPLVRGGPFFIRRTGVFTPCAANASISG